MTSIYRDDIKGTRELFSSILDNRLNNAMKYLTSITLLNGLIVHGETSLLLIITASAPDCYSICFLCSTHAAKMQVMSVSKMMMKNPAGVRAKGIPSVAFSNCDYNSQSSQTHLTHYVRRVVERVLAEGLPKGVCLNVNFPDRKTFEGIRACRMTFGEWVNEVAPQRHPLGYPYYWMVGHYRNAEPDAQDTDQWALAHGYVAVTPTTIDVTAYQMIDTVNNWNL